MRPCFRFDVTIMLESLTWHSTRYVPFGMTLKVHELSYIAQGLQATKHFSEVVFKTSKKTSQLKSVADLWFQCYKLPVTICTDSCVNTNLVYNAWPSPSIRSYWMLQEGEGIDRAIHELHYINLGDNYSDIDNSEHCTQLARTTKLTLLSQGSPLRQHVYKCNGSHIAVRLSNMVNAHICQS